MQWMSNLLPSDNRGLQIAVIAGLVAAALLLVVFLYRLAFGRRLRVPGSSRTRQPRLGLVDAFSLDGQRQLVLVRRDNVEHLVMIGGPNDVLVESQIVRAAAPPLAREREAAAVKALPVGPARAAGGAPPAVEAPPPEPPALRATPRAEAPTVKPAERIAPAPGRPPLRAAAPAGAEARPEPPMTKPEPPLAKPEGAPPARPVAAQPAKPAGLARSPLPPPIAAAGTRPHATPVAPAAPETPPPAAPPPGAPAASGEPAARPADPFADLEALEAEMARLLGRDV